MRTRLLVPVLWLLAGVAMGAGIVWWLKPAALPPALPIHNPLDRAFVSMADGGDDLALIVSLHKLRVDEAQRFHHQGNVVALLGSILILEL